MYMYLDRCAMRLFAQIAVMIITHNMQVNKYIYRPVLDRNKWFPWMGLPIFPIVYALCINIEYYDEIYHGRFVRMSVTVDKFEYRR